MVDNSEPSLLETLQNFLTDDTLNDVTLKGTDGVEVSANRWVLSSRSKVFKGMLLGKFQEASSTVVEVGFNGSVLRAIVEYILTDSAEMLNPKKRKSHAEGGVYYDFQFIQSLVKLAEASSYFQLPGLEKVVLKKFEEILKTAPGSSFAILQACKMAAPSIPETIAERAMDHVRSVQAKSITKEHVHCLSSGVLEEILQDEKTKLTEYQLFQILDGWAKGSKNERSMTAKHFSKHIHLSKIDPQTLSTTINNSGLVSMMQLCEAYKWQALEANKVSHSVILNKPRYEGWTTEIPPDCDGPMEIKVEGAGLDDVNGSYVRDGSFNGKCKYSKHGEYDGNACVFWLFYCSNKHWYISIPRKKEPGTRADKAFYVSYDINGTAPPSSGWGCSDCGDGVSPAPKLFYKVGGS